MNKPIVENLLERSDDALEKLASGQDTTPPAAYTLTLKEVASWQLPHLAQNWSRQHPPIIAALPSLQRGAVWKPNQVELLWDSILRGFPVGSLVVSRKLEKQNSRPGAIATTTDAWNQKITHHLLDGQQRSNAIALGFQDPFALGIDPSKINTILWLDLQTAKFSPNSSRTFMARVTTKAHPWGYQITDELGRLGAADIREKLEGDYHWVTQPGDKDYDRPRPTDIWPLTATCPIPMAWLIHATEQSATDLQLWKRVLERCNDYLVKQPELPDSHWVRRSIKLLENEPNEALSELKESLLQVPQIRLVALNVPDHAIHKATRQETETHEDEADQRIANVEHLFQRLNAGGTELRGDELLYSMIKAYWPGIETTIDNIKDIREKHCRPPATQVALLGARLALSDLVKPEPRAGLSVAALRSIARAPEDSTDTKSAVQRRDEKMRIESLFALGKLPIATTQIDAVIRKVDEWLLYDPNTNPNGLPPVLRSRMAEKAPEVFHFLMCLAYTSLSSGVQPTPVALTRLRGFATALHWFGLDASQAVAYLWTLGQLGDWLTGDVYVRVPHLLTDLKQHLPDNRKGLVNLLVPSVLDQLVLRPDCANLETWNWWNTLIRDPAKDVDGKFSEDEQVKLQELYWQMLDRLRSSEFLLIYGQREWMAHRFGDYDPSVTGFWEEHNRPWDYDHILPQNVFNRVHNAKFLDVCKEWGNTIGNLHVLPFEENRCRQDSGANQIPDVYLHSALLDEPHDLRNAFSITREQVKGDDLADRDAVCNFVNAARTRLLRLYRDWFRSMDIGSML